jgi:hypothetical protein
MEKLLRNCTVIEGHLGFTNMLVMNGNKEPNQTILIPSFPELREITDFLLLYLGDQIKTLANIFPNLSVIRGTRLLKVKDIDSFGHRLLFFHNHNQITVVDIRLTN